MEAAIHLFGPLTCGDHVFEDSGPYLDTPIIRTVPFYGLAQHPFQMLLANGLLRRQERSGGCRSSPEGLKIGVVIRTIILAAAQYLQSGLGKEGSGLPGPESSKGPAPGGGWGRASRMAPKMVRYPTLCGGPNSAATFRPAGRQYWELVHKRERSRVMPAPRRRRAGAAGWAFAPRSGRIRYAWRVRGRSSERRETTRRRYRV